MVYVEQKAQFVPEDQVAPGMTVARLSGTEFRRRLREGIEVPEWFSYPEIIEELRKTHPPKHLQGITIFFTGLSGSGKSTIANALLVKLLELGTRRVTLLDGDVVRKHLSSELGFSREHRDINILRIGYVASEITKYGGVAICAPIAPYAATRRRVREMVEATGGFVEIHVATPLEVCESRDRKGLVRRRPAPARSRSSPGSAIRTRSRKIPRCASTPATCRPISRLTASWSSSKAWVTSADRRGRKPCPSTRRPSFRSCSTGHPTTS